LLQQPGGADGKIDFGRHAGEFGRPFDAALLVRLKPQPIATLHKLKDGLQQMVAIGAPADDAQHSIELGRSRPGGLKPYSVH